MCRLEPIKHRALDFAQHRVLLCYNHATYCLFELVSRAKQENLSWSNVSFILRELQLLVWSHVFCRVSSEIKKYNFEMKKPSRRTILVHAIALYGESFRWAAVFTEYELLMQISKSTRHALDSYVIRTQLVPDTHSTRTRLALENVKRVRRYLRAVPHMYVCIMHSYFCLHACLTYIYIVVMNAYMIKFTMRACSACN